MRLDPTCQSKKVKISSHLAKNFNRKYKFLRVERVERVERVPLQNDKQLGTKIEKNLLPRIV